MFRPGKDKGIATPVPLGLAALGVTSFLMGVALIAQPVAAWGPYLTNALLIGGLAQFLAGMWAFAYGDPLAATVFSFIGAFDGWWAYNGLILHGAAAASLGSMSLVFIVCGVMTLCFWVASFNETAVFNVVLLFLWIGFILDGIAMAADVNVLAILGGIAALISGIVAAYGSFAELYNAAALVEVVPTGEFRMIRERSEHEEQERLRRLQSVVNHEHLHA